MIISFRDPETPLTPEQAETRKLTYKQISTEPQTFSMDHWSLQLDWLPGELLKGLGIAEGTCGTARCVSGWAQFFGGQDVVAFSTEHENIRAGIELLGLTYNEYYGINGHYGAGARALFFDTNENAVERMRVIAEAAK
jgi:hypothetical protein